MSSDRCDEQVLRILLSPGQHALARVVQILVHRRIEVCSLVLSPAVGEPSDVGTVGGISMQIELANPQDRERAVRFLGRCIDVISIDAGYETDG